MAKKTKRENGVKQETKTQKTEPVSTTVAATGAANEAVDGAATGAAGTVADKPKADVAVGAKDKSSKKKNKLRLKKHGEVKVKKTKDKKPKKNKHPILKKISGYFKDLRTELKRVVWPTGQKVFRGTVVVLVTVLVVAIIVVVLDLGFHNLLKLLLGKL